MSDDLLIVLRYLLSNFSHSLPPDVEAAYERLRTKEQGQSFREIKEEIRRGTSVS